MQIDISSIINRFINKSDFYILLISTTLVLLNTHYNIIVFPWYILLLCTFLLITLFFYSGKLIIKYCKEKKSQITEKQKNARKCEIENERILEAFYGLSITHKMEALIVIEEIQPIPSNKYKFVIATPSKYTITNYYCFESPFNIRTGNILQPYIYIDKQSDYCTITFNHLFYDLLAKHSTDIKVEYNNFCQKS